MFEELSTADAAEALGVAPGTVKSRLSRAKARLADLLAELGATDTNDLKNGGER